MTRHEYQDMSAGYSAPRGDGSPVATVLTSYLWWATQAEREVASGELPSRVLLLTEAIRKLCEGES